MKGTSYTYKDIDGRNDYLTKIVNGPWDEESFVKVLPFGVVEDEFF